MGPLRTVHDRSRLRRPAQSAALARSLSVPVILLALATTGCPDEAPRVHSVEVIPIATRSGPDIVFELLAVARDEAGAIIRAPIATRWSGDPVIEMPKENPTRIKAGGTGSYRVRARMGKVWSPEARIEAEAGASPGIRDEIHLEHTAGARPSYVLLDAAAEGEVDCAKAAHRQFVVAGKAILPLNLTGTGAACPHAMAVFARGRAPLMENLPPNQWTAAAETLARPSLPQPIIVPVTVFYRANAGDEALARRAKDQLDYANWIFEENGAGVRLDVAYTMPGLDLDYDGDEHCTNVETLLQFTAPPGRISIVYVTEIAYNSRPFGWSCPATAGRGPVVLLSWARPLVTTLAHELMHGFGFASPPFTFAVSGHANSFDGFDGTNLLWIHGDPTANEDRRNLTLGQIYRMHADATSWLSLADGLRPPAHARISCQGDPGPGKCPPLALDMRIW